MDVCSKEESKDINQTDSSPQPEEDCNPGRNVRVRGLSSPDLDSGFTPRLRPPYKRV